MDINEALEQIIPLFNDFVVHPLCITELQALLSGELSGQADVFLRILITQLNNILVYRQEIHTIDKNEKLKHSKHNLYSVHLQRKQFNVRLLIAFDVVNRPYLLTMFYERSGKRKTDYSTRIPAADNRFSELLERRWINE